MSTLKANTLTGTTSAGSINVTGEGGSTTTNLQQGLVKSWVHYDENTAIQDSFNTASLSDGGTGQTTTQYTNNMASVSYCPTGSFDRLGSNINSTPFDGHTTSSCRMRTHTGSGALDVSTSGGQITVNGDLA